MAFDIKGKVHVVGATQVVSERFSKRELVVEVEDGKYPQLVSFQVTNDRVTMLDEFRVGDEIRVTFNVRGREWKNPQGETKYFNSLDVWKLEAVGAKSASNGAPPPDTSSSGKAAAEDDIPFATCAMRAEPSPLSRLVR